MTRYVIAILAAIAWMPPTPGFAAIEVSSSSGNAVAEPRTLSAEYVTALQAEVEPTAILWTGPRPSMTVAMPLADVFEYPYDPIAESQAIVAVEPPAAAVVVPEPHSAILWVLTIAAAICGSRVIARIQRR